MIFPQWISFDLSTVDNQQFKKTVEPTIVAQTLSGQMIYQTLSNNNRLGISFSFPVGFSFSADAVQSNPFIHPFLINAAYMPTENLILSGSINWQDNSQESVQITGYSGQYFFNHQFLNIGINQMTGAEFLMIRFLQAGYVIEKNIRSSIMQIGVGGIQYKAKFKNLDFEIIPQKIDNSIGFLFWGTKIPFRYFDVLLQTKLHANFLMTSLSIHKVFF